MTFSDLLSLAFQNLLRVKLRTFLTITGVVIAIAAFVALLSFGAGNQQYVTEQFEDLGLFTTMIVYPPADTDGADTTGIGPLDNDAIAALAAVPGVNLAYPLDAFDVAISLPDSQITTRAQALPSAAADTKMFSRLLAGSTFTHDSAREAIVTDEFLESAGISEADSAIGLAIRVSTQLASVDSGLAAIVRDEDGRIRKRLLQIRLDSLLNREYRRRVAREEIQAAAERFMNGFSGRLVEVADTLTITGVIKATRGGRMKTQPVVIPVGTARRFTSGGISTDPADLFSAMTRGELFETGEATGKSYPRVTLNLDPRVPHAAVSDSVEAMGFRTFSFAREFDRIRKFFLYFDLVLGVIGAIALITAALGIINTMIMSIIERTREIGILKALGSDDRDIALLFLIESGVIGAVGSIAGIIGGWIVTRIVSMVAKAIMLNMGADAIEMFMVPAWLIAVAFLFGLVVSVLAGLMPARRAARVDPVVALRNE